MTFVNFMRVVRVAFLKWRIRVMTTRIEMAAVKIKETEKYIKAES